MLWIGWNQEVAQAIQQGAWQPRVVLVEDSLSLDLQLFQTEVGRVLTENSKSESAWLSLILVGVFSWEGWVLFFFSSLRKFLCFPQWLRAYSSLLGPRHRSRTQLSRLLIHALALSWSDKSFLSSPLHLWVRRFSREASVVGFKSPKQMRELSVPSVPLRWIGGTTVGSYERKLDCVLDED